MATEAPTYLSVMRIDDVAGNAGIELTWKPLNIRTLMVKRGLPTEPFIPRPEMLAYMWRDLERRAERRGLPYRRPPQYPVDSQQTVRLAYLAAREGWCSEFFRTVFQLNCAQRRSIGGSGNLEATLRELARDPESVIARARQPEITNGLAKQTRRAVDLGMFSSPHFRVDEELFWGNDRLEDAVEWCLSGKLSPSGDLKLALRNAPT